MASPGRWSETQVGVRLVLGSDAGSHPAPRPPPPSGCGRCGHAGSDGGPRQDPGGASLKQHAEPKKKKNTPKKQNRKTTPGILLESHPSKTGLACSVRKVTSGQVRCFAFLFKVPEGDIHASFRSVAPSHGVVVTHLKCKRSTLSWALSARYTRGFKD